MITEQQFKLLITKNIEVFADDPLQLRRDFYSQGYKLASEGFTEALYKAKLMNTICALLRPDINLEYAPVMPQLPLYVDAGVVRLNQQLFQKDVQSQTAHRVMISIYNEIMPEYTMINRIGRITMFFRPSNGKLKWDRFNLFISIADEQLMRTFMSGFNEKFLKMYRDNLFLRLYDETNRFGVELIINEPRAGDEYGEVPNVFRISRMLKLLFDLGLCRVAKLTSISVVGVASDKTEIVL